MRDPSPDTTKQPDSKANAATAVAFGKPKFATAEDVRFRAVLDEGIVIRQRAGEVLVLNAVGVRVLELIEESRSMSQMVDLLVEEFAVEHGRLEKDVASFTHELEQAGVLVRIGSDEDLASSTPQRGDEGASR